MFEWEERKLLRQHLDREEELKKKEHERLKKITKKEKCYHAYKEWLKKSLIKQRQELDEKKIENYQRKEQEEIERREKENLKVKAKIAYKEWRERKNEEARHKRKVDRMEKRRQEMEEQEIRMARRKLVKEMKYRQSGGGNQILLAYGLNKNLKKLDDESATKVRAKSAKGARYEQL